jgi:hypothetical protein
MAQLQRNDPTAAVAAYRDGLAAGTWSADKSRLILAMQDDPTDLLGLIQLANADPAVGDALRKMMATALAPRSDAQARDYHGRFAPGHGAGHDAARRVDGAGYNPNRDGDGKFASGPHADHDKAAKHARAAAALADPSFTAAHAHRLALAEREARSNFPAAPHGEEANRAVANWRHAEAMRIHAERDAHGDDPRRKELAEYASLQAHYDGQGSVGKHESAMKALAEDHAAGLEERRAALAGHVQDVPHAKHDAFIATREQVKQEMANAHADLDRVHGETSDALDRLRAVDVSGGETEMGGHKGWESKIEDIGIGDLKDHYEATSMHLAAAAGGGSAREFGSHEHDEVPFPQREDHATERDYQNALAAHENTFRRRAWLAQSALERLHAQQTAAATLLKDAERKHDKAYSASTREIGRLDEHDLVNQKAFAHYERDAGGDIKDEIGAAHLARAEAASARRVSVANFERENARMGNLEDARDSLHEETKVTRDGIRALSKITGRAPKLSQINPRS